LPYENTIRKGGDHSIRDHAFPYIPISDSKKCGSRTARERKVSCESRMVIKKGKGALHEGQTDGDEWNAERRSRKETSGKKRKAT